MFMLHESPGSLSFAAWGSVVASKFLLALSPGPAVGCVVAQSAHGGRGGAYWASAGVVTVNGVYFTLSVLGLGVLLEQSPLVLTFAQWAGGTYLIAVGVRTAFGRGGIVVPPAPAADAARVNVSKSPFRGSAPWRSWRAGAAVQAANPKALVFFVLILPRFVQSHVDSSRMLSFASLVVLGVSMVLVDFGVLTGYGVIVHAVLKRTSAIAGDGNARSSRALMAVNRAIGVMLVATGVGILVMR